MIRGKEDVQLSLIVIVIWQRNKIGQTEKYKRTESIFKDHHEDVGGEKL